MMTRKKTAKSKTRTQRAATRRARCQDQKNTTGREGRDRTPSIMTLMPLVAMIMIKVKSTVRGRTLEMKVRMTNYARSTLLKKSHSSRP